MNTLKTHVSGIGAALILAVISIFLASYTHLIGASVVALLLGMIIKLFIQDDTTLRPGLNYASKKILRIAIVLLGASISVAQILYVGRYSLIVMVFTLASAFGFGWLFGRILNINWRLSSLISAGTGICGGSAIAAVSSVIDADDSDIAYAIAATFIFDIAMVILFPLMGQALNMSDLGFGLWAGTAINDTSSVVAAAYTFSDAAGEFATIVKLTRTMAILPVVLIFALINRRIKRRELPNADGNLNVNLMSIFPWFILMFIGVAGINSLGLIPLALGGWLKSLSKFLLVVALGAIGLKTDFNKLRKSGFSPMLLGFIISTIVVVVSYFTQYFIGQI